MPSLDVIRRITVQAEERNLEPVAAKLRALAAAQGALADASADAATVTERTSKSVESAQRAWDGFQRRIDPIAKELQGVSRDLGVVQRAFNQGIISAQQLAAAHDMIVGSTRAARDEMKRLQSEMSNVDNAMEAYASKAARRAQEQIDYENRIAQARHAQQGQAFGTDVDVLTGVKRTAATDAGATYSALAEQAKQLDAIDQARAAHAAESAQMQINGLVGVRDAATGAARASASVFEMQFQAEEKAIAETALVDRAMQDYADKQRRRAADAQAYEEKLSTARAQGSATSAFAIDQRMGIGARGSSAASSAAVFQEQFTAQEKMERAAQALRAQIDPLGVSTKRLADQLATYDEMASHGVISTEELAKAQAMARAEFDALTKGFKAGGKFDDMLDVTRAMAFAHSLRGFSEMILQGVNPIRALAMEFNNLAYAASGPGGIGGLISKAKELGATAISYITPAIGAVGGFAAAGVTAGIAYERLASSQRAVAIAIAGVGRASQTSVDQIGKIAVTAAETGKVSVSTARSIGAEFAGTGKITAAMYGDLIGVTKDFATATGTDLAAAQKTLAAAFADPAKGAETLNTVLGGLDATTKRHIEDLAAQGDRLGAQRVLMQAYGTTIKSAGENVSVMSRAWDTATNAASNFFDRVGKGVANVTQGGSTLEEQLSTATKILSSARGRVGILPGFVANSDVQSAEREVARLREAIAAKEAENARAAAAARTLEFDTIVKSANAGAERLRDAENTASNLTRLLKEAVPDPNGLGRRTLESYVALARQLKEDLAAGGAAFADAIRQSEFAQRTLGFSSTAASLAQINKAAEDRVREINRTIENAGLREQQLRSVETVRQTEQATALEAARRTSAAQSGAFYRAPADIQGRVLSAEETTGISRAIIAAIGERENSFRLTGGTNVLNAQGQPSTSAQGFGQITIAAEKDIQQRWAEFDRFNADMAVRGTAEYLKILQERHGDMTHALSAYYAGDPNDPKGLKYAADILRRAGEGGAASAEQLAQSLSKTQLEIDSSNRTLGIHAELLGRDGTALDAATRLEQARSDAIARGIPLTQALSEEMARSARTAAELATALKGIQLSRDIEFERSQVGRTAEDQAAFARARSTFGDTDSPAAREAIDQLKINDYLRQTKQLGDDALKGFLTDLRNGKSASEALAGVMNKIADKLISIASDQVMSSLIGGLGKSLLGGSTSAGVDFGGGLRLTDAAFVMHGGGMVGIDGQQRYVHPAHFDDAPRFHSGVNLGAGEVPAILQVGEMVLSRAQVAAARGSKGGMSVTIAPVTNVDASGSNLTAAELDAIVRRSQAETVKAVQASLPAMVQNARKRGSL